MSGTELSPIVLALPASITITSILSDLLSEFDGCYLGDTAVAVGSSCLDGACSGRCVVVAGVDCVTPSVLELYSMAFTFRLWHVTAFE